MPWEVEDVEAYKKGLTDAQKRKWVAIANDALESCREQGGTQCDRKAIIRANGAVSAQEGREEKDMENEAILETEIEAQVEAEPEEAREIEITGDVISLVEGAVRKDGIVTLKVIAPGWGSSGYYPADVLARDGAKTFTKGTKMFWDHATSAEEAERPEGRLDALAGEFVTDALWHAEGAAGPGLYADAKVFGRYRDAVAELAPHIGVSIRAMGKAREGEADGKRGPVIQSFSAARSVDFVTQPGAGGQIVSLFEAARGTKERKTDVNEEQAKQLNEANVALTTERDALLAENATLRQALFVREATEFVVETLKSYSLPQAACQRLTEALVAHPPLKEGALDQEAYAAQIDERAKAEIAYIESVTKVGEIEGLGVPVAKPPAKDKLRESYENFYRKLGKTADEAAMLAEIAAQGR